MYQQQETTTTLLRPVSWDQDFMSLLEIERNSFAQPWTAQEFATFSARQDTGGVIAVSGDRVVGYLLYERRKVGHHIAHIAVAPEMRGHGIGRELIHHLRDRAGMPISLNVRRGNEKAIKLYANLGFAHVETIHGHYRDGEDALVMRIGDVFCEASPVSAADFLLLVPQ